MAYDLTEINRKLDETEKRIKDYLVMFSTSNMRTDITSVFSIIKKIAANTVANNNTAEYGALIGNLDKFEQLVPQDSLTHCSETELPQFLKQFNKCILEIEVLAPAEAETLSVVRKSLDEIEASLCEEAAPSVNVEIDGDNKPTAKAECDCKISFFGIPVSFGECVALVACAAIGGLIGSLIGGPVGSLVGGLIGAAVGGTLVNMNRYGLFRDCNTAPVLPRGHTSPNTSLMMTELPLQTSAELAGIKA